MVENILKQNVLAFSLGVVAVVLGMFATGVAQTLDQGIQAALDRGDTAVAIDLLDKQINLDKGYYYNYYIKGRIYYSRNQYEKAAEMFQLALEKKSKHWESVKYFGLSELQLGELDQAEKVFKDALKKVKDEKAEFDYLYGLVLMARKSYNEADVQFRKAIASDDKVADYHIGLGDANFYNGVPALAVMEYEKALQLDTAGTEVYFHWADACLEMKDYTCALDKLSIVLRKDSTFAPAWRRAGSIYFKAARSSRTVQDRDARYMDAIGAYAKFFDLSKHAEADSSTVREYFETAMAYTNLRRYEDALPYFDKVLAIPYEPRDVYFYFGKALWGTRDYVKGAEMLQKHLAWAEAQNEDFQSRVEDDDVYKLLGDCYYYREGRDFSTAVRYYEKSLEAAPHQPRVLQNVAVALHTLNRFGEALHYYDLRIEEGIDSSSAAILKNASLCALSIANQNAASASDDLLEEEDDGAMPGVDPNQNYHAAAAAYMNDYLTFVPNDVDVLERLGNTQLYQLADCENGVATFERLLTLSPDNCQAKKSIGFAYFSGSICRKDLNKTLRYLLQAYECMSSEGPCKDVALVKWIAQAYHLRAVDKTGDANSDFKNAFDWYGKVLKCTPGDAEAVKGQEDTRFEFN